MMRKTPLLFVMVLLAVILAAIAVPAVLAGGQPAPALQKTATPIVVPTTTPAAGPASKAAASPTPAPAKTDLSNTYVTIRVSETGKAEVFSLRLNKDGTAEFAIGAAGEKAVVLANGTWKDSGDRTLTLTISEWDGKQLANPIIIKFKSEGAQLTALEYDQALLGSGGLALTRAAEVAKNLDTALFAIDLQAGFPLDPTFISVNGGGEVDASKLGGECRGFIHRQPVVTVNWSGKANFVEAFFYSKDDPTLVILTPEGKILCNDDANPQLLDPVIRIENPAAGTYRIWVGSYARNQLIPGVLVLTTKPEVNVGDFNLGSLVSRPAVPAVVTEPTPQVEKGAIAKAIEERLQSAPKLQAGGAPVTAEVAAAGQIPLFELPLKNKACAGLVSAKPDYVFNWSGKSKNLRIFFEGDRDATLLVLGPNELAVCGDDTRSGVNINPLVDLPNPVEGLYGVWVGRLDPSQPVKGKLTITEATDAQPAKLAPAHSGT